MITVRLSEIANLQIHEGARKLNKEIYEFIACLLSEYAISLGFDSGDNAIYAAMNKYFAGGEISAKNLIDKLCSAPEIEALRSEFPELMRTDLYDYAAWARFLMDSSWSTDEENNIFLINGKMYKMPLRFLCIKESSSGMTALRLRLEENGTSCFRSIGNGDVSENASHPYIFYSISEQTTNIAGRAEIEITEEEFFELDESIKSADAEQKEAIRSDINNDLVILAGAGSGKTRTLVCRLAFLHLVKKIPLNKILLLTFTTSAANEMKRRSIEIIEPIYSKFRPLEQPTVNSRTIDSFVVNLIDTYYTQIGFTQKPIKYLDNNEDTQRQKLQLLEEVILENRMQGVFKYYFDEENGRANEKFRWLLSNLEDYACGVPINCAGFETLLRLYLNKQRLQNKVMGFTEANLFVKDAIQQPNSALRDTIVSRYSCILIDEFQDVNVLQNSIFEPFYDGDTHFTFVGDDDQSIYYWRGSDSTIIKKLLHKSNVKACYLLTNYRNNPNIVNAGNAVLKTISDRAKKDKPIHPHRENGAKI